MLREDKKREWFLALAMGIMLLTPFFVVLLPRAIADTLHHSPSYLMMFVTNGSYVLYLIGFILIFAGVLSVYFLWGRKLAIYLFIGLFVVSGLVFYSASTHYIAIGEDDISYTLLFSSTNNTYQWEDIEHVSYKRASASGGRWRYEFTFTDGEKFTVIENGYMEEYRPWIIERLKKEDLQISSK